jgi:N-acetylmuramoyl-L-alanine amidase
MRIGNADLLEPEQGAIEIVESPNHGGRIVPEYLVIHYTAGRSGISSVNHFLDPQAKASAHIVLDRSGRIWQLVPFTLRAWHAGVSAWAGRHGLNDFSIGIEIDNAGRLQKTGSRYQAWFGGSFGEDEVIHARHKNEQQEFAWHAYTEKQLDALMMLSQLLVARYRLKDVVGHDDIAPGRKADPGPAFAMNSFRSALFGRGDSVTAESEYVVSVPALNLRGGPGTEFPVLQTLSAHTRLSLLEMRSLWAKVVLLEGPQTEGWVRNSFVTPLAA